MLKFLLVVLLVVYCIREVHAVCGNNILESGEQCDNTTAGGCCTTTCLNASVTTPTNPSAATGSFTLPYALSTTLASIGLTTAGANYPVAWSVLSDTANSATYDPGVVFSISGNTNLNWNRVYVGTFNVTFQTIYCTNPFRALYFQRQLTMNQYESCTCVTDLVHPWCTSTPTIADETRCDCFTRQCYRRDETVLSTCGTTTCRDGYLSCSAACADLLVSKPRSFTIIGNDCDGVKHCSQSGNIACTCNPTCGDGVVDSGEGCDTGSPAPYGSCCTHSCSLTPVNPTPTTGTYTMPTCSNSTTMAALNMLTGRANYIVIYEVVSVTNVSGLGATITGGGLTLQFNKTFAGVAVVTFRALYCNATSQYFTFTRTITGIGCCKNGIVESGEYCDVGPTSGQVGSCCTTDCQAPRFNSGVTYYPFCRGIGRTYTLADIGLDTVNVPANALTIIRNQTWYEGVGEITRDFYTDASVPSMITNGTSTYLQFAGPIIGGINVTWSYNYCSSPATTLTFWKTFWIPKCYCDYCASITLPGPVVQGVSGPDCYQLANQFSDISPYGANYLCDCSKVTCYQLTSSDTSLCASGLCGYVGYNNCSYACRDVVSPKPISFSLQRRQTNSVTGTTCTNSVCGAQGAGNPVSEWINCTCAPVCGDGVVDTTEFCDIGDTTYGQDKCCTTNCGTPVVASPATFSYTLPTCAANVLFSDIQILTTGGNFQPVWSVANYTGITGLSPSTTASRLQFGNFYTGTVTFTLRARWCNNPNQYVYVTRTITSNCCDNSNIDAGEDCDLGPSGNGGASTCCSNTCQFRPTTRVCRSSGGTCDPQETCTGTSDACPTDILYNSTVQCRANAGPCDIPEFCTGTLAACPADTFLNSSTLCRNSSGICDVAEFCSGSAATCPNDTFRPNTFTCRNSTDLCDAPETCTGSSATCPADAFYNSSVICRAPNGGCDATEFCTGSSATCPADLFFNSSVICRPSGDLCDAVEFCPGNSNLCPADAFFNSSVLCRPSAGPCDITEFCTGSSRVCPADTFVNSSVACRAANDTCDVTEFCTGSAAACPANSFANSSAICRPANGGCDVAETCTGTTTACPIDSFQLLGFVCRPSADVCDTQEVCSGVSNLCPADTYANASAVCRSQNGACDEVEYCTGSSISCPPDVFYNSTVVCRNSTDVCDATEYCTGVSNQCPIDGFYNSTVECRASSDVCDIAEFCTGSGPSCPVDGLHPNGYLCRSSAGDCDIEEVCTGLSPTCPIDSFYTNTRICRNSTDICDLTEYCTGVSATCPANFFVSAGTVCRAAVDVCDAAEVCDGVSAPCPVDIFKNSSTQCRASADVCDEIEFCTGTGPTCPVDSYFNSSVVCRPSGGTCDQQEFCPGNSSACPPDVLLPLGYLCDPSLGICENNSTCTGSSAVCPAKTFVSSLTVCRTSTGPCDPQETCTGSSELCPVDLFLDSSTICRNANGLCDAIEYCTGISGSCPVDSYYNSSVICRPPVGLCDAPELCTGTSPNCPVDVLQSSSYVCAASTSGCTSNVTCTGLSSSCPSNLKPAGSPCSVDGNLCYLDLCASNGTCLRGTAINYNDGLYCNGVETCNTTTGLIIPGTPPNCNDGNSCTIDTCSNLLSTCVNTPAPGTFGTCGGGFGACTPGNFSCDGTGPTPVITCVGAVLPVAEACFDLIDNDCDGLVDEFCDQQPCITVDDCTNITYGTCDNLECTNGFCNTTQLPVNSSCDDRLGCTYDDRCDELGNCVGKPVICDDQQECTYDYCTEPYGRCVFDGNVLDNAPCSFGECNNQGQCEFPHIPCPVAPEASCIMYVFNKNTGICEQIQKTGACDDGDECTRYDVCIDGVCVGEKKDCDDFIECTIDSCVSPTGSCVHTLTPNTCRIDGKCWMDGDVNTECDCAMCNSSLSTIAWSIPSSNIPCDDGNSCTSNDVCDTNTGQCQGILNSCPPAIECHYSECVNGACQQIPYADGTSCDDDDVCTTNDVCTLGICRGGQIDCSSFSSECTIGVCDPMSGCIAANVEDNTLCNLGADACLGVYTCSSGACVGSGPLSCPSSTNPCTSFVCDATYGCVEIALENQVCDDGNACTVGDVCNSEGICTPGGIWINCDDQNDCTDDFCTPLGGCIHIPISNCQQCNATADCSLQTCQQVHCVRGTCRYIAEPAGFSCADNDVCNGHEVCTGNGVCVSLGPLICDDNNPCTDDSCNPLSGCAYTPNTTNACSDNKVCTVNDVCHVDGTCAGEAILCPVDTTCLDSQCRDINGVATCVALPINEGSSCTTNDGCKHSGVCNAQGVCVEQSVQCPIPSECVQSYFCANSSCHMVPVSYGTPCDASNLCKNSICDGSGSCIQISNAINCTTSNPCEVESVCVASTGECVPVYAADGTDCDDADLCTASSFCRAGQCSGSNQELCLSPDSCHGQGICDPLTGTCTYPMLANFTPCIPTDVLSNESMTTHSCFNGVCISSDPVYCPPSSNECLVAHRDAELGCIYDYADSIFCDDDDICTYDTTCIDGECGGGQFYNCSYGTKCALTYCLSYSGCISLGTDDCKTCSTAKDCPYIPCKTATCELGVCAYNEDDTALSGCDDNQFCNGIEYCFAGSCHTRPPPNCDDNNDCTIDTCDYSLQQCRHVYAGNVTCQNDDLCAVAAQCDGKGHCLTLLTVHCDESTPCRTSLGCNPKTGACMYEFTPDGHECASGDNKCAASSICHNGICNVVENITCDRSCSCDASTTCDALTGSCIVPTRCNNELCSDGNDCTLGDRCSGSTCTPGHFSPCDHIPHNQQCQISMCSANNGSCYLDNIEDGTPCMTNLPRGPCTADDVCINGACVRTYKENVVCREATPSGCDVAEYCQGNSDYCPPNDFAPDNTTCANDLYCYDSQCKSGRCLPTTLRDCSSLNTDCTIGICDEERKACVSRNKAENTPCISGKEGQCVPFSRCQTGVCTEYYANELTPCDDGSLCTTDDHCSGYNANCVAGSVQVCSHLDSACSLGVCNPLTGQCVSTSINEGVACNADANPCTVNDTCVAGVCVAGSSLDCSYLNSSCQYGICQATSAYSATCTAVITGRECDPDYCSGGCVVPYQWWALHNSRCRDPSKQFTWPNNLENALMCDQTYYYWSQKRAQTMWRTLMLEWLAATLNAANGACTPVTVDQVLEDVELVLRQCNFSLPIEKLYKSYAIILKSYNTGILGPGECTQAPCATPLYDANYFACLFQTRDMRDDVQVEYFSAETCQNGLWDYVSDSCQCFMGWAGIDCSECAPSINEGEVFICVPVMDSREYSLRSIPIDDLNMYMSDSPDEILEIIKMTGRRARYPGDDKVDCACNRIEENQLSARDLSIYIAQDDTMIYIGSIEQSLELCEQTFDVTIMNANPLCDNQTSVILPGNDTSCDPPTDWNYICDCCLEEDDDCACPKNDILCLRNHIIREHSRLHLFQILFIVFFCITAAFILLGVVYVIRRIFFSRPQRTKPAKAPTTEQQQPIKWSLRYRKNDK